MSEMVEWDVFAEKAHYRCLLHVLKLRRSW